MGAINNYYGGNGAFHIEGDHGLFTTNNTEGIVVLKYVDADFSAARSSAIYTSSGKVYPASLVLNYIIKA